MRMWLIKPRLLCRQHLLGEHVEMHMFAGTLRSGHPAIKFYMDNGFVVIDLIRSRHDELVEEIIGQRGWNHNSPLRKFPLRNRWVKDSFQGVVDPYHNMIDLLLRCQNCRARAEALGLLDEFRLYIEG